jgi:hypothetical protein
MKPHVICLMASSVDGRTLHSRWRPKGSGGDLFESGHDELAGDAWLVGRVTGQERPSPSMKITPLACHTSSSITKRLGPMGINRLRPQFPRTGRTRIWQS